MNHTPSAPSGRRDLWIIGGIALLFLGVLTPMTGIWEPWEADRALVLEQMRTSGQWLQVHMPSSGDKTRAVAELPYSWLALLGSTALFGVNEIGLRLPGVLLGILTVLLTFITTRRSFGRVAAYAAALGLLMMPLFAFHARLALGSGVEAGLVAVAGLSFFHASQSSEGDRWWVRAGWLATALAGLVGGAPALGTALITAGAGAALAHTAGRSPWRLLSPIPMGLALAAVAGGWALAALNRGDGTSLAALLVWADPLAEAAKASKRPFFSAFTHQLGFGLFPLGAFVPLAFAELLWDRRRDDEGEGASVAGPLLGTWLAVGFLVPAIFQGFGQAGFMLAAPAVAVAVGVYFARVLRSPPQPLLALTAVILVALLDSNLKHDTHSLADLLVGGPVGAFPDKLPYWSVARLLDMGLLGLLLFYQGGLGPWLRRAQRWLVYPDRPIRLFSWVPSRSWLSLVLAVGATAPLLLRKPDWFDRLLQQKMWGRMLPGLRLFVVVLVVVVVVHLIIWAAWNLRHRRLQGRRSGLIDRSVGDALTFLSRPQSRAIALGMIFVGFAGFMNVLAARAMTTNFSQKDLLVAYEAAAAPGEPLFAYRLDTRSSSFYARNLQALKAPEFTKKAKADARFFALVPRKQLATINSAFRKATGETVPVLDERSERYLLISNQLREGEEDFNPIKRAIVPALPAGATSVDHVFEGEIALVGWMLEPKEPRPGSPLKIHLYWKALKKVRHNWKMFVHIDAPGQRIHGDHDPVEGLYPSSNWSPGDIVHDEHRVVVKRTTQANRYTFYTGLYRGSTRMKVTTGKKDKENRANIGRVRVR
jgi:hypothetical protein